MEVPKDFLWGAASSGHQVEGNNTNSDWWFSESQGKLPRSGRVTDHYHRYEEDFNLAKQIGLNALRISIEWARIEPQPGIFDKEAVDHYRSVLLALKARGLTRMVTLHHFTLPQWLAEGGGFANPESISFFGRYAKVVAEQLGGEIDLWLTINEPEIYTSMTSLRGAWPPFAKNPLRAMNVFNNLAKAHIEAYQAIKSVLPDARVGVVKNNIHYEAFAPKNILDSAVVAISHWFRNHVFLNKLNNKFDFIGLNYYFYNLLHVSFSGLMEKHRSLPKSDMGWQTYPEGIYHLLVDLGKTYRKPLYVTENGIANAHDDMRKNFIRQHMEWVVKAAQEGADVRGYFYWSLTDTYEWQDGFNPKFGLIEINFDTLKRTIRPSAEIFKQLQS